MERIRNIIVVLGLIGGLMSMGTVIGGFVQLVRYWDQFVFMSQVVNEDDVVYYHQTLLPQHKTLWKERD